MEELPAVEEPASADTPEPTEAFEVADRARAARRTI